MAKFRISFVLLLSVIFSASAQEQLTHFRATSAEDQLSNPTYFTEVNGKLLFLATQGDQDTEIWVVDGTPGTPPALLKDINPGASGSAAVLAKFAPNSVFESAAILNGFLYFSANDGQTGFQLWKTDGTAQHTERVTDNLQAPPFSLTVVGTTLYFMTGPYQWANTLWKSDGTKQGTTVVAADFPKYSGVVFSVACNNMLFFALGQNGSSEFTLWRSNGTTGGTMAISDPLKGIGNSDVMPVAVHNNELYVVAKGDVFGEGNTMLFKMDGNSGYSFIKSLDHGGYGSFEFADARVFDDHVYFSFFDWDNNREIIWKTDGTLDGAVNLYDVAAPSYFTPMPFYTFDNTLVFSTANADKGTSLSGIAAGSDVIEPIADISQNDIKPTFYFPGISEGIISKLDDRYVIQLSDDWFSTAAYLSDLTTANTKRVSLLDDVFATYLFKDRLYFRYYQEGIGSELFSLEPGSETPSLVANINTTRYGMSTLYVRTIQDNVFFDGVDVDRQLWLYQGNPNSIKGFDHDPYALTVIGDQLYYSTNGAATASELRRTANETSTVIPPKDANQAATYFDDFTLYKNSVYFTALSNATGTLFLGKIEDSGYSLITDLGLLGASYTFSTVKLKVSGDKLYVGPPVANDIWVSDGTASGTTILLHTGSGLSQQMEAVDNRLFFFGISDTGDETGLWVTQGTKASTVLLKTFNLNEYTSTHGLVRLGNAVLFNASTAENGSELWRSDGTPEGTTLVKDIFAGPASGARDAQLTVYQGKAYFNGTDPGGSELWVTDGTTAGTKLVKDINAIGGSVPKEFAVVGDFLYFQAYDPTNGTELWRTDGTAANTKLVSDVAPGSISSNPAHIVGQGDDIVFVATVGIGGDQLWRVTPTPITDVESPEQGELLAVYPNPAETRIMLHTKTPAAIRNVALYDLQGRNVTGVYSGDDNSMSVGHLSAGVYILTAETPQGQFRTLVVKK